MTYVVRLPKNPPPKESLAEFTRKGHAASVRRQGRLRLRSLRPSRPKRRRKRRLASKRACGRRQPQESNQNPSFPGTQGELPRRGKRGPPGGCASEMTLLMAEEPTFSKKTNLFRHVVFLEKAALPLFRHTEAPDVSIRRFF